MKVTKTKLEGAVILEPDVFGDNRGFFMESWSKRKMEAAGLFYDFVQDNHSSSTVKGTLRGIHFQKGEWCQAKLVRCTSGRVLDVAVDLRRSSPTFGKWAGALLSAENKRQLWVPEGFAHGFYTLGSGAEFVYKCTDYYNPKAEHSLLWNDKTVAVDWPLQGEPLLSTKDLAGKVLAEAVVF